MFFLSHLIRLVVTNYFYPIPDKSLEDLRISIFNDLHTSEGAKRMQQRVCGPTAALSFNFLVSVAIILTNKLVCQFVISNTSLNPACNIFYLILLLPCNFVLLYSFIQVLGKVGFNYPICLTFIHYMSSLVLMAIMNAVSLLPVTPPTKSTPFFYFIAIGMVTSLSNGLANVSLKYNRYFKSMKQYSHDNQ